MTSPAEYFQLIKMFGIWSLPFEVPIDGTVGLTAGRLEPLPVGATRGSACPAPVKDG